MTMLSIKNLHANVADKPILKGVTLDDVYLRLTGEELAAAA